MRPLVVFSKEAKVSTETLTVTLSGVAIALAIVSAVISFWNEWRSQSALKQANDALVKITGEASITRTLIEQSLQRLQEAVIGQMQKGGDTDMGNAVAVLTAMRSVMSEEEVAKLVREGIDSARTTGGQG